MNLHDLGHFARVSLPLPDPWRRPFERKLIEEWCHIDHGIIDRVEIRSISGRSDCEGVFVRTEDTFNINFERWDCYHCLGWQQLRCVVQFCEWFCLVWFLSLSNRYYPETLGRRLKYVCGNIFNLVNVYTCCCKIFKGFTFFLDTVYIFVYVDISQQVYKGKDDIAPSTILDSSRSGSWLALAVVPRRKLVAAHSPR